MGHWELKKFVRHSFIVKIRTFHGQEPFSFGIISTQCIESLISSN